MFQRNEVKLKKELLRVDLEEEEQQDSEGHKDLTFPIPKQKHVYKRKVIEVSVVRRTTPRLKTKIKLYGSLGGDVKWSYLYNFEANNYIQ
jgi:hypothetical protein